MRGAPEWLGAAEPFTLWLMRHGQTEWSREGRFTGRTDIGLTERGRQQAREAGRRCAAEVFDVVVVSPLRRARESAELAGFGGAECEPLVQEWDYGEYEGVLSSQVRERIPGFTVWDFPAPGGESIDQVAERADTVLGRLARDVSGRGGAGQALIVAHGHFLRVLTCRWLGWPPSAGRHVPLGTAALATLGWDKGNPAILAWGV